MRHAVFLRLLVAMLGLLMAGAAPAAARVAEAGEIESLRAAILDLRQAFGPRYASAADYLARLERIEKAPTAPGAGEALARLRREALLANPLVDFDRLLLLKRKRGQLALPTNHQCNTSLKQRGYDNEIAVLSGWRDGGDAPGAKPSAAPPGKLSTLFKPGDGAFVGEIDLHFDAGRLLFTMPDGRTWNVHEIGADGTGLRRVSRPEPDVNSFDACYLPDGRIVYASTAAFTGVPCWHGKERACSLYSMDADGSGVRQLCFDQDLDLHPAVLGNGQVIYSRWDYTGIMHVYLRPLMTMNPDGTNQRSVYGSNSYFPNSLFYPRAVPGSPTMVAAILSGYHGPGRMGELVVLDTARGWREADGIVHRIGHRGEPVVPEIKDNLIGERWPKFLHPYPLSEKYLIAAAQLDKKSPWGVYLVDAFDNLVALALDPASDFFEPIPLRPAPRPPVVPSRVDPSRSDATVHLHDVYAGPGLAGVPRGSVKRLRIAAYHFGYPGMAGPDRVGRAGPWDVMRVLGTVPVEADGSASFRVPASTPITIQPLDREHKALALMRSWYTAMPGETVSCVGCHEDPRQAPAPPPSLAARPVREIEPWYGPARGFDFEREVQPVLDRHCVGCHDGKAARDGKVAGDRSVPDLRGRRAAPAGYDGLQMSKLDAERLDPLLRDFGDRFLPCRAEAPLLGDRRIRYSPAYQALVPFVRRVNIEDYVGLHVAGEYHADTSELVQLLRKGHYGVKLDAEAWERIVTWIDLNGPYFGTWGEVGPIPGGADKRRRELALRQGGPREDPEAVPQIPAKPPAAQPAPNLGPPPARPVVTTEGWPFDAPEARRRQRAAGPWERSLDLGDGVSLKLVRIPAGSFVMGSDDGDPDESPRRVVIPRDFWIGATEVTNRQFRRFAPDHFSGYFMKRSLSNDGPGVAMDDADQPAVRVSWERAAAFCRWLGDRTGKPVALPTEEQWEYACRAGAAGDLSYGDAAADFSAHADLADAALRRLYTVTGGLVVLQDFPAIDRVDDRSLATAPVGSYKPNAWGLFDMHGNAAEWTRTGFRWPDAASSGDSSAATSMNVVRGGSFLDRPHRARSAFRLGYPAWQRVHNVGLRVVCEAP